MIKRHAFFVILLIILLACQEEEPKSYDVHNSLSTGHFEGLIIGDSLASCTSLLSGIIAQDDEEILFKKRLEDNRLVEYNGYLIFDKERLYEITIDFQLSADSLVQDYFIECKTALDKVYGLSEMDNGYAHWSTGSVNEKVIEIELFNEYLDSKMPIVSIQFFEDFDKQFYAE